MYSISNMLNILLESLNSGVSGAKFFLYYPNQPLSAPLKNKFCGVLELLSSACSMPNEDSRQAELRVKLMSPMNSTGAEVLLIAEQVSDVLKKQELGQQYLCCTIGNIEHSSTKRCYTINIDVKYKFVCDEQYAAVEVSGRAAEAILLSEKCSRSSTDIKVYGESKPFDSILTAEEYRLKIQLNSSENMELNKPVQISYKINGYTVIYKDCTVTACTTYIDSAIRLMELTTKNRVVVEGEREREQL